MISFFDDGPAFRVYDTEGNLVHPEDGPADEEMASLSHAGVDLHLDSQEDVALLQFKAQRPEDSRGEFYHLEVQGEDPTSLVEATQEALGHLRSAGWALSEEGSVLAVVEEFPALGEVRMDELTARAVQRVCEDEGVAFRVGSARVGLQVAKRLARNGSQPPSVTVTDNPNFTADTGLVLYAGGNGGVDFANRTDRKRVTETKAEIRSELEAELEDELVARIARALRGQRGSEGLQTIADLTTLMDGGIPDDKPSSEAIDDVAQVLGRAEGISARMRDKLARKGRDVLEEQLKAHVGEADGYACWWMLIAFVVGVGVTVGGWWAWNALGWSVGVPFF